MNNFYKSKKVLVTGGAGFIGSHIVDRLLELGAKVAVLDNLSSGSLENLKSSLEKIKFIEGDIRSQEKCLAATKDVEVIFHLAAFVSVPQSIENPALCHEINVEGSRNILNAASSNNVKAFVLSSSAAVYGNRGNACREEDLPNPQSPYAQSKLECEAMCKEFALKGLSCVSLRYFNVCGPRQNAQSQYAAVVAIFTELLLKGKPLTIFGDGKQIRDFVGVSKVVDANLLMGSQSLMMCDTFNIASGRSINLLQLIEKLKYDLNVQKEVELIFKPQRPGDIEISMADCSKFENFSSSIPAFALQSNKIQKQL